MKDGLQLTIDSRQLDELELKLLKVLAILEKIDRLAIKYPLLVKLMGGEKKLAITVESKKDA